MLRIMIKELHKHILLYFLFIRRYIISQMEYRGNFFSFLILEILILISKLLYVVVIYRTGVDIDGLPPDAILMFTGTFFIISAIYGSLFLHNFYTFQGLVSDGELDLYMTKPVSLQFMATMSKVDFAAFIPNMTAGIILVMKGWKAMNIPIEWFNILGYIGFIFIGVIIMYCILLFPQLLAFWTTKTRAINEITSALSNFNVMPMMIYKKWMQRLGTFVVPIFLITNFAPLFVLDRLNHFYIWWCIFVPILSLLLIRIFWNLAIKKYNSASS
ncbi:MULTISPECIES: ABC transporter permease [Paenibacillus]|uniref:ABC transporter permease n=1 Tax=Paenibacillus TaxID=44249 RepID=UPI000386DC0C|nr:MULTISPECIES: ABC-2 family transporter protein [Paenibacillus]EPY11377.1 hypothetical protein PAAL66ix_18237 [Paenibacillus alvei A6-6i-x]SDF67083.1 ABC-2 type transport system permease protein [Paenibacillus sp. cl6col]